jgi:hypothetical protein
MVRHALVEGSTELPEAVGPLGVGQVTAKDEQRWADGLEPARQQGALDAADEPGGDLVAATRQRALSG